MITNLGSWQTYEVPGSIGSTPVVKELISDLYEFNLYSNHLLNLLKYTIYLQPLVQYKCGRYIGCNDGICQDIAKLLCEFERVNNIDLSSGLISHLSQLHQLAVCPFDTDHRNWHPETH